MYLITNVKTIFNQDIYKQWIKTVEEKGKDVKEEFPPPITQEIVCLGYMAIDEQFNIQALGVGRVDQENEKEILQYFSSFVNDHRAQIITWNGKRLELPIIVYRCLHHLVPLSWYFERSEYRYRFTTEGHFDLSDYISDHFSSPRPSLDAIARLIGLPGRLWNPFHTSKLYNEGKLTEIVKFCITDIIQIYAVFLRIMYLRGLLENTTYYNATNILSTYIKNISDKYHDTAVASGCTLFLENC